MSRFAGTPPPKGRHSRIGRHVRELGGPQARARCLRRGHHRLGREARPRVARGRSHLVLRRPQPRGDQAKGLLVTHMFNHQTHHRGQVHCMLTQCGAKPGVTDLPLPGRADHPRPVCFRPAPGVPRGREGPRPRPWRQLHLLSCRRRGHQEVAAPQRSSGRPLRFRSQCAGSSAKISSIGARNATPAPGSKWISRCCRDRESECPLPPAAELG